MEIEHDITTRLDRIGRLLDRGLGPSRAPLDKRLRRAGRLVPARIHKDVALIQEAGFVAGHPRLGLMIDRAALDAAFDRTEAALARLDRADRRKGFWLGLLGGLVFNLLLFGVLLLVAVRLLT